MPGHKMSYIAERIETCSPEIVEAVYAVMTGVAVATPKEAVDKNVAEAQAAKAKADAEAEAKAVKKKADAEAKAKAEADAQAAKAAAEAQQPK